MPKKRLFVTLEGQDGSGKTTQRGLLAWHLKNKGYDVVETREPGGIGSPIAEAIRSLVLDPLNGEMSDRTELLLFEAARAQHLADTIIPALQREQVVICDRFIDSTVAYQVGGRGLDSVQVKLLNDFATGGVMPDLTLVYERNEADFVRRSKTVSGSADRIEKADLNFHARVRAAFVNLAATEKSRVRRIVVDGKTPEQVAEIGLGIILEQLK